ncbi:MAG TPA: ADOP family duplicated permease [Gemmatimonadaceae bacterium]|nr:ADOP family duplicated permease [Gemmatimonadaceae bacterium]
MNRGTRPPDWPARLLSSILGGGDFAESVIGDLTEEYAARVARDAQLNTLWYWRAATDIALHHIADAATQTRGPMFGHLREDLRYARRQLATSKAFTLTTIFTLALGIGATTAMFGIERTLTDVRLDIANPATLVHVGQAARGDCAACGALAAGNFTTLQQSARSFVSFAFATQWRAILRGDQGGELLTGAHVSSGFFNTIGVRPLFGRVFTPADSAERHANVVMLSESFWRGRLGGDSAIVGRTLVIDGTPRVVVGIVPTRAVLPEGSEVWAPLVVDPMAAANRSRGDGDAFARLAVGTTLDGARAELRAIGMRIVSQYPTDLRGVAFDAEPFAAWETPSRADDIPLFVLVYMVLGVACLNLAGLLLARLTARRKEMAIRVALGASRARIVWQLLTETTLLTFVGGVAGAAVAAVGIRLVRDLMPAFVSEALPRWHDLHLDGPALAAALITSVLTGVAIGLLPALRFTRDGVVEGLKSDSRSASAGGGVSRTRRGLVVAEVALAVVLLGSAGLLARSVANQRATHDGFRSDSTLTFRVTAPPAVAGQPRSDARYWAPLAQRFGALPNVVAVSSALGLPYSPAAPTEAFTVAGRAAALNGQESTARIVVAGAGYFSTLGISIRSGRSFDASDRADAPRVAIVDEHLARIVFGNADPIGRTLVIDNAQWRIVGVAAETRPNARRPLAVTTLGELYLPLAQRPTNALQFVIRTRAEPLQLARAAMATVHEFHRDLAVTEVQTFTALVDNASAPYRVLTGAMIGFAAAAATIALIGLYGIVSFVVAQRMREFGIRRALGAETAELFRLVLGESAMLAAVGIAIGVLGALGAGRVMRLILVGVSAADPLTLAAIIGTMMLVAVGAAYGPARRAAKADPMAALRNE